MDGVRPKTPPATTSSQTSYGRGQVAKESSTVDIEELAEAESHLRNNTIKHITWKGVSVTVRDRKTKQPKTIIDNVQGIVKAGEVCALMGPSGSGKTTLLNVLARRPTNATSVEGTICVNGSVPSSEAFRNITCFVEQEDALIGSLTVKETLHFASRLATTGTFSAKERIVRINGLLRAFGLLEHANSLIGTPIRKGISGGQKRRVGVASTLITSPKIMFLDEPTSGLDSQASWEVVNYLRGVAQRNNLIVIASIHQPSTSTFNLFDKLLLLSGGRTHYFGPVAEVLDHYDKLGYAVPYHVNPAEYILEITNIDFTSQHLRAVDRLGDMQAAWRSSLRSQLLTNTIEEVNKRSKGPNGEDTDIDTPHHHEKRPSVISRIATLLHRNFIKSRRDVVAYGIRLAMYTCLAIMSGTVWLRLQPVQGSIIPITNAIFFGGAFMSFMAVAYVPSFLEDRAQYVKEHHNGLYGATELVVANFLIGFPYLLIISIVFSAISYWLTNFNPTVESFSIWVLWLFLDLLAAEGLVVFVTALVPNFVVALAVVAFANGLWMCVSGFMVYPDDLNSFYKYGFHYWDYQKYVFEGMIVNEFKDRVYECGRTSAGACQCMFESHLIDECKIAGQGVLDAYKFDESNFGQNLGIMICIIVGYRVAGWLALLLKKH